MGVLTHRLHGSITALAAMAALSSSSDLSDKSGVRSLLCETGQTFLLSSLYAPTAASSFDLEASPRRSPSMEPTAFGQPPRRSPGHVMPGSPFTYQTTSLRFHQARTSQGYLLRQGVLPVQEDHLNTNLLSKDLKPSPWMMINAMSARTSTSESIAHVRGMHWNHPFTAQRWHARISAPHTMDANRLVSGLPHMHLLDKLFAVVYGAQVHPPMGSASLLHMWHFPLKDPQSDDDGRKPAVKRKPSVAVILLGWLGAEQRHLKKYADWYTSQGFHAVTFVVPMKDLLTLKGGDNAEKHVGVLTQNLVQWLKEGINEDNEKMVIFHTFSNTGWLVYGAVLERLISQGDDLLERIKGCVVDSAPSARPDPHVWASGFSAALLKKGSVATQISQPCAAEDWDRFSGYAKPSFKESALLAMLENFFSVFLHLPYVHRRLSDVVSVLANKQPACPQLYIYSSADAVIPAKSVESFIEEQKKAGHMVEACDFQFSPHVDHFRTFPERYMDQLTSFLKLCMPQLATS